MRRGTVGDLALQLGPGHTVRDVEQHCINIQRRIGDVVVEGKSLVHVEMREEGEDV